MQPTAQSGIVWKISIFLFILLAVVLYKMNDYFKQEKWQLAQNQLRTQVVSAKTSVSSQLSTLKNVLSSYEYELSESKINWVQLDPFFGIAKADRVGGKNSNQYHVSQYVGRSGSFGANWNAGFLQKALSRQFVSANQPITIQLFQDQVGAKFISLRFANQGGRALIVVGGAEYFQKYFDLSRGGKMTSLLETTDHILAAHSEADYLGSLMDENAISGKKFLVEREEIAGTNLVAMNFMNRKNLTSGFAVPWSVVGLIIGFGLLIIGVLIYTLDPIERRIERYKVQEREQIFKETLSTAIAEQAPIETEPASVDPALPFAEKLNEVSPADKIQTATDVVKEKLEKIEVMPAAAAAPTAHSEPMLKPNVKPARPPTPVEEEPAHLQQTYIPAKQSASMSSGTLFLDSEKIKPVVEYMTDEPDTLDLEKVLALDDLDAEESAKTNVQYVQENLTSKKINTTQQMAEAVKPTFAVKRKDFKVDAVEVAIRRPDRS